MPYTHTKIWNKLPADIDTTLMQSLDHGLDMTKSGKDVALFFRADDAAVPGQQFKRLLTLFIRHNIPLGLAVVPTWLTRPRWKELKRTGAKAAHLWCWHQHGWRHQNHETVGKKQEFGPERTRSAIEHDLSAGRKRLETIIQAQFTPIFTPPWNRCGTDALELLTKMNYHAVSRSDGSLPPSPHALPDLQVNVDLHTRKDASWKSGWKRLLESIETAVAGGQAGIMIHHQRMNPAAFEFLETLLKAIRRRKRLVPNTMDQLAGSLPRAFASGDKNIEM